MVPPEVTVPTCVTGVVEDVAGRASVCLDNAPFQIVTLNMLTFRLFSARPSVEKELKRAAQSGKKVVVCGTYEAGPECPKLMVYSVGPVADFMSFSETLWDGDLPWPDTMKVTAK